MILLVGFSHSLRHFHTAFAVFENNIVYTFYRTGFSYTHGTLGPHANIFLQYLFEQFSLLFPIIKGTYPPFILKDAHIYSYHSQKNVQYKWTSFPQWKKNHPMKQQWEINYSIPFYRLTSDSLLIVSRLISQTSRTDFCDIWFWRLTQEHLKTKDITAHKSNPSPHIQSTNQSIMHIFEP